MGRKEKLEVEKDGKEIQDAEVKETKEKEEKEAKKERTKKLSAKEKLKQKLEKVIYSDIFMRERQPKETERDRER